MSPGPQRQGFEPRALLLIGGGGASKTSVGQAIGALMTGRSHPTAVVDLDALAQFGGGAPAHEELRRRNLTAVWTNYRSVGARYVVVSGMVETAEQRTAYGECLVGCNVQVVRLATPLTLVPAVRRGPCAARSGSWAQPSPRTSGSSEQAWKTLPSATIAHWPR